MSSPPMLVVGGKDRCVDVLIEYDGTGETGKGGGGELESSCG